MKALFALLIFVVLLYPLNMSIETWGMMPKSQEDAETIEEAIDRIVAVHEAAPTAHTGENESLAAHRENEVLDHLAGSVVADKFSSSNRFIAYPYTPDFDSYSENYTNFYNGALNVLQHNSALTDSALAQWVNYQIADMGWDSGDIVVDFQFSGGGASGTWQGEFNVLFAKVQVKTGYYRLGYYNGSWQYGSWISYSSFMADRWRIYFSAVDGVIYFFFNGQSVGNFTATPQFDTSDYMFNVNLARGTSVWSTVYFGGVQLGI